MSQPGAGSSRVERKKEETKRKIIEVALNLFKQQGFEATTMEQIASVVDIAKGTLYNYFPVKEAILNEYIQRAFQARNMERRCTCGAGIILENQGTSSSASVIIIIQSCRTKQTPI